MKLIVLAGAKEGTEIPLKREKFTIGRSSDCTLRTGSEAISRHHCAILRTGEGISVRDLGSRNGTYVNDQKIEQETALRNGDTIRVGSLQFRLDAGQDILRAKKPKVSSVADAVSRAATGAPDESAVIEDDISRWLLGADPTTSAANRETQSIRMDETKTIEFASPAEGDEPAEEQDKADSKDSKQANSSKKSYGKLPPIPKKSSKDSREAAADVLREMTRRR